MEKKWHNINMIKFNKSQAGTCSICGRAKEDVRTLLVLVKTEFKMLKTDNGRIYKVCSACLNTNTNAAVIGLNEPRVQDLQAKIQKKMRSISLSTRDPQFKKKRNVKTTNKQRS